MLRVLVIDDDRELCQLVSVCLVREGMNVQVAHDGRSGLNLAISGQHDLAILDVMLQELTGLQVLEQLRSSSDIGILMLTARGEEADRIIGLEYGADDYLSKPFSAGELVARIRALARRLKPWEDGEIDAEGVHASIQGLRKTPRFRSASFKTGLDGPSCLVLNVTNGLDMQRELLTRLLHWHFVNISTWPVVCISSDFFPSTVKSLTYEAALFGPSVAFHIPGSRVIRKEIWGSASVQIGKRAQP
jgi:CheY-like chemotaxis protein